MENKRNNKKKTKEQFIEEAYKVHGNKYDYSKVEYINSKTKVCIICPIHGEFLKTPNKHLLGQGCPFCSGKKKKTKEEFIKEARKVHGDKYDYSKVEYINSDTKIIITCHIHGDFEQVPYSHLQGKGCKYCNGGISDTKESFIEKARLIHGNKYDYSKVEYINSKTKVCIICPIHGEILQTPNEHLQGYGCLYCNESHLERNVCLILEENNIQIERQKKFEWLGKQSLDFYLPQYNIGIECQGIQHFKPIEHFGGKNRFKQQIEQDEKKFILCKNNNVKLLYINYNDDEKIIKNKILTFINK